jgi:hypothetical protein
MPAIGTPRESTFFRMLPYTSADDRISGSIERGMVISAAMVSSQDSVPAQDRPRCAAAPLPTHDRAKVTGA